MVSARSKGDVWRRALSASAGFVLAACQGTILPQGLEHSADADSGVAGSGDHGANGGAGGASGSSTDAGGGGRDAAAEGPPAEPLHRLNRLEYDNTVRDLLGVDLRLAQGFPPDGVLDGFDNMALALSLSPSLMGLYASAARQLSDAALDVIPRYTQAFEAKDLEHSGGFAFGDWAWALSGSSVTMTLSVPEAERVTLSILAGETHYGGSAAPIMTLHIDGTAVQSWTVTAAATSPLPHDYALDLAAGDHELRVSFDNHDSHPAENRDNQIVVGTITARSDQTVLPPSRAKVYVCDPASAPDPEACYRTIVTTFAQRAWRRPLTTNEADRVFELWRTLAAEETQDDAVKLVVRAMLMSSQFLYRASVPSARAIAAQPTGGVPLDDYALASRLSYFVWSSMPDDALLGDAASGALHTDAGMRAAVQRMLGDSKADALRQGFAAQWLALRTLATAAPSSEVYPEFDEPLRAAMTREVELFFDHFLHDPAPITDMLDPSFGFANDRLAAHYGFAPPGSEELVRVELDDGDRRGLITQAAWLTAYSEATRTSPVRRGRFLLEQILCSPVPPPPPDIPAFEEQEKPGATVRETLALHRANPQCAVCHDELDPMGLGLEELDGIGALRTTENGAPVDSSGALTGGRPFNGGAELAAQLEGGPRFTSCLTEKLLTYALGYSDKVARAPFVDAIAANAIASQLSLGALIEEIAVSAAFRTRTEGEP